MIKSFESLHAVDPNPDIKKILGILYARKGKKDAKSQAVLFLQTAAEYFKNDTVIMTELARLLSEKTPVEALNWYKQAERKLRDQKEAVPYELRHNMATLYQRLGKFVEALDLYKELITCWSERPLEEFSLSLLSQKTVTSFYNMARLYEDCHERNKALEIYQEISARFPLYAESYLRQAAIAMSQKRFSKARHCLDQCLQNIPNHPTALAFLAQIDMQFMDWASATNRFNQIYEKDSGDAYSLISIANIQYQAKFDKAEKAEIYFRNAASAYRQALDSDRRNVWAANGLAIILADKGETLLALRYFEEVLQSNRDIPDVLLNIGHVHMKLQQFDRAVKHYDNCLSQPAYSKDTRVMLCLAHAQCRLGKLKASKQTLLSAIHLAPQNLTLWYNLGVVQKEIGFHVRKDSKSKLSELLFAQQQVQQARDLFEKLSLETTHYYRPEMPRNQVISCETVLSELPPLIEKAQQIYNSELEVQKLSELKSKELVEEQKRRKESDILSLSLFPFPFFLLLLTISLKNLREKSLEEALRRQKASSNFHEGEIIEIEPEPTKKKRKTKTYSSDEEESSIQNVEDQAHSSEEEEDDGENSKKPQKKRRKLLKNKQGKEELSQETQKEYAEFINNHSEIRELKELISEMKAHFGKTVITPQKKAIKKLFTQIVEESILGLDEEDAFIE